VVFRLVGNCSATCSKGVVFVLSTRLCNKQTTNACFRVVVAREGGGQDTRIRGSDSDRPSLSTGSASVSHRRFQGNKPANPDARALSAASGPAAVCCVTLRPEQQHGWCCCIVKNGFQQQRVVVRRPLDGLCLQRGGPQLPLMLRLCPSSSSRRMRTCQCLTQCWTMRSCTG
jgi:hypothetical protein